MNTSLWHRLDSDRRADLGAILVIAAVFIAFFSPILFRGKIFVTNDAFIYSYPLRSVAWDQIRHGAPPLWTPLLMSGYPLLSMAQIGIGYPLTWGYLFLPGFIAEEIYVLAPFLLAPAFMYAFVREIGRSRTAALLAALSFGYGGMMFSPIAHNGMLTNALMWTPLILIAIERARTGRFARCLFWASVAYSLASLTGIGQGLISVVIVTLGYAIFISLAATVLPDRNGETAIKWRAWQRWRPLAVALGAVVIGSGVTAFQIFETIGAQRLSIRSALSYETFGEGAFPVAVGLKSLVAPLYYQTDVTTYMVPLAVLLAGWAIGTVLLQQPRDPRVIFWLAIAGFGWMLMLGPNTAFYRYLYMVPVLNKFRVPSRHTFEWTFAVATMSAYGWDAVSSRLAEQAKKYRPRVENFRLFVALVLFAAAVVSAVLWWLSTYKITGTVQSNPQIVFQYLRWKILFTLLILVAVWQGWRMASLARRTALLRCAIVLVCFVEPAIAASHWWWPKAKTADRFSADAIATRWLREKNPQHDRIYTHTSIWSEEYLKPPRIDPPNFSALRGLRDVGGYEPLFLERYSRALGNVTNDGVYPRPGYVFDGTMFDTGSHVLDLLNTRFVVAYSDLATLPDKLPERDGVKFFPNDSYFTVKPGERKTLSGASTECDMLALVTALANGAAEQQEATIAKLSFRTTDGKVIERSLRAGIDTAEWAIESPGVGNTAQHKKAKVFDSHPADEGKYKAYRFWSLTPLEARVRLSRIEIENVSANSELLIWKASLYDSATHRSIPLPHYDEDKWRPVYDANKVLIIENAQALPRAWLVAEAEAVDDEEGLRRIRGESEHSFDPRRTVLLEVSPQSLPPLPGGPISPAAHVQLIGEGPGHLSFETSADSQSVLVVSEINYPGWEATVDGTRVPVYTADFLLRGVEVPPGTHHVEMSYTAPGARSGAIISALALCATGGLGIYSRRRR